jgi:hypothetical protein
MYLTYVYYTIYVRIVRTKNCSDSSLLKYLAKVDPSASR